METAAAGSQPGFQNIDKMFQLGHGCDPNADGPLVRSHFMPCKFKWEFPCSAGRIYRGVALVRPFRPRNREIAESKLRNRNRGESRNRKKKYIYIYKKKIYIYINIYIYICGIVNSRKKNRGIAIGIGNRKHATSARIGNRDLESEIALGIGNRELEIGNRIANMLRQIRWWPSSSSTSEFF